VRGHMQRSAQARQRELQDKKKVGISGAHGLLAKGKQTCTRGSSSASAKKPRAVGTWETDRMTENVLCRKNKNTKKTDKYKQRKKQKKKQNKHKIS